MNWWDAVPPPDWRPSVGDWVIYQPRPEAQPEDGEVTELRSPGMVMVRYRGDVTAKATSLVDLRPGQPQSA